MIVCSSTRRAFSCSSSAVRWPETSPSSSLIDGVAAVELDHLPGGGFGGLVDLGLELMDADGRLGAQPVLVGANLRLGQRHGALQHLGG